jgi:hypothetical protein
LGQVYGGERGLEKEKPREKNSIQMQNAEERKCSTNMKIYANFEIPVD